MLMKMFDSALLNAFSIRTYPVSKGSLFVSVNNLSSGKSTPDDCGSFNLSLNPKLKSLLAFDDEIAVGVETRTLA
jgi:hypothetical protein